MAENFKGVESQILEYRLRDKLKRVLDIMVPLKNIHPDVYASIKEVVENEE